jgi:hypothetical protein
MTRPSIVLTKVTILKKKLINSSPYNLLQPHDGTALQLGRSRVRFPVVSLEFFSAVILPATLCPWGLTQVLTEMSTRNISWGGGGVKAAGA